MRPEKRLKRRIAPHARAQFMFPANYFGRADGTDKLLEEIRDKSARMARTAEVDVLERAARIADDNGSLFIAASIRALKPKPAKQPRKK